MAKAFKIFPAPAEVIKEFGADRYTVEVSQPGWDPVKSFVCQTINKNPVAPLTLAHQAEQAYLTKLRIWAPTDFKVTLNTGDPITSVVIKPKWLGIKPTIEGNTVRFTMQFPYVVTVLINETFSKTGTYDNIGKITKRIPKHPLVIQASKQETDIPDKADKAVRWFEPGIHDIGLNCPLPNGSHWYLDGWAFLRGGFQVNQSDPSDINVHGNGVVTAKGLTDPGGGWINHAFDITINSTGKGTNKGKNNRIAGISIMDPLRSCIVCYNPLHLEDVTLHSWEHTQDGFTMGSGSTSAGVNFVMTQDDPAKFYFSNQTHLADWVIYQQTSGSPCKMGWKLNNKVNNVHIKGRYTLIESGVFNDYSKEEKDSPENRSPSAFFSCMGIREKGAVLGIEFDHITIEAEDFIRLWAIRLQSFHNGEYWGKPAAEDVFHGLKINRLDMAVAPYATGTIYANAGGSIGAIEVNQMTMGGKPVRSISDMVCRNYEMGMRCVAHGGGTVQEPVFRYVDPVDPPIDPPDVIDPPIDPPDIIDPPIDPPIGDLIIQAESVSITPGEGGALQVTITRKADS